MIEYKADFTSIPWEAPLLGMRQKIHKIGSRQLRLVEYSRDMAPHWCGKGHIGYVLDGKIEITFASGVHVFSAGDGIFIPGGSEHKHMARALTGTVTVVFVEEV